MDFFRRIDRKVLRDGEGDISPFLIVGLGNPGRDYRETRHNIGFMVIDYLAETIGCKLTKVQSKAIIGTGKIQDQKVILVKPQTFMNLSGQAVSALMRFYKVDYSRLIVAHDDVDLLFGQIRMRPGGGSAGQKGVTSIIEKLGSQEFSRLRMGIGRPPGQMDSAAYVLQTFNRTDSEFLPEFLSRGADAVRCFVLEGLDTAMNRFNPKQ
ncbi:MAG: peptidyl-tRNA hydrolase PTH1 family [Chloroflexi bacterium]|nr:MAG: peptidyl-tRNA hydrolase PTH1 family [Chloroflexota bacterium]